MHDFCLVHIYFFILKLKGHEFYLFIYFLVGQYLNILEEEKQIYIYIFKGKSQFFYTIINIIIIIIYLFIF